MMRTAEQPIRYFDTRNLVQSPIYFFFNYYCGKLNILTKELYIMVYLHNSTPLLKAEM